MRKIVLTLSLVVFIVVVALPLMFLFYDALTGGMESLRNIKETLFNPRIWRLIVNSLTIGLGATLLGLVLGVPLGFFICRTDIYFRNLAGYLYLISFLIPSHINAIAWIEFFGAQGGMGGLYSIYAPMGVVWVLGLSYFPFISLLTITGLLSADRKLEEQAQLVAGRWTILRKITFPLIVPFITAGALFVFVFSLSNYSVPALLRVNAYPIEIFTQFSAYYDQRQAVLSSLPLLFLTTALVIVCYGIMKNKSYVSLEGASKPPTTVRLGAWRALCSVLVWGLIIISGIFPLIVLIMNSGPVSTYGVAIKTSIRPILISLGLSLCGASACAFLGFFLGYFVERLKSPWRHFLDIALIVPLAVPAATWGIGLIKLWNQPVTQWIYSTPIIVVFGFIASFLPFAVKTMASNFKQLNYNMEEAGILNKAGFLEIMGKIMAPLTRQAILISWIICFIFCMGESTASLLVIPAGIETLSIKIYSIMHYGVGQLTSALCVVLIVVTMIPVALLGWAFRRGQYDYA